MASRVVSSWGNVIHERHSVFKPQSRFETLPHSPIAILPYGNGRSYGDSCLNVSGALVHTRSLDRFIQFDRQTGVLACEAGVLLSEILALIVPAGWFLPVVPGTSHVTLGGAIANDVHGKNHHRAGTLGCHVLRLELLRSNGERLICSPSVNPQWFGATVGGLGLTGMITWAELQLRPVPGEWLDQESIRYSNLQEFFDLCAESERDFEYTVAWLDCLARGKHLGRGLLQRANHAAAPNGEPPPVRARRLSIPFMVPVPLVNTASVRIFNSIHYHRQRAPRVRGLKHFEPFFFPLDGIANWNRLYGPRGFYQFQCVIPTAAGAEATRKMLETIARSGSGSFLAVLKRFGPMRSPGMLSFPQEGVTLALDFPNTHGFERQCAELDAIVADAGGRIYPAKDGRMPGRLFRSGYPLWSEFSRYIDPAFSSSFWRRVTRDP
jgi:FAD/FMN-containing dehydrogenase